MTRLKIRSARAIAADGQPQSFIERIDFVGNRRVRTDTLKARIFSREGDPYNEDTLRRDFQALWNTQFFEDVKLGVEDSPTIPTVKSLFSRSGAANHSAHQVRRHSFGFGIRHSRPLQGEKSA